jgi:hypothetical protein
MKIRFAVPVTLALFLAMPPLAQRPEGVPEAAARKALSPIRRYS